MVRVLRDRSVEGRLSTDTFAERVGLAYGAESRRELAELVSDVRLTIGRAPGCDCLLPEDCVSRRHAELRRDGGRWFLRDLGSSNGTRVNGMRVIEATEVRPGDRLSLGGAAYRLRARRPRAG